MTQPAPSLVGMALNTRRELIVKQKSWSQSAGVVVIHHSVQALAALVAIGLATVKGVAPSGRAHMGLCRATDRAIAIATATDDDWAAAAWPMALQLILEVCGHGRGRQVEMWPKAWGGACPV